MAKAEGRCDRMAAPDRETNFRRYEDAEITANEAKNRLGIGWEKLQALIELGILPAREEGSKTLVKLADCDKWRLLIPRAQDSLFGYSCCLHRGPLPSACEYASDGEAFLRVKDICRAFGYPVPAISANARNLIIASPQDFPGGWTQGETKVSLRGLDSLGRFLVQFDRDQPVFYEIRSLYPRNKTVNAPTFPSTQEAEESQAGDLYDGKYALAYQHPSLTDAIKRIGQDKAGELLWDYIDSTPVALQISVPWKFLRDIKPEEDSTRERREAAVKAVLEIVIEAYKKKQEQAEGKEGQACG